MICKKCSAEIPDDAVFCKYCGMRNEVTGKSKENKDIKEKKCGVKKKNHKGLLLGASFLLLVIGITVLFRSMLIPEYKYNTAKEYEEEGYLYDAYEIYKEIRGYKDSDTKINEIAELLSDRYENVKVCVVDERYMEAYNILLYLGDYQDCAHLLEDVEAELEEQYESAINRYEREDFIGALVAFRKISSYKDSEDYIEKCEAWKLEYKYGNALKYFEEQQYEKAREQFLAISEYKDSARYAEMCIDCESIGHDYQKEYCTDNSICSRCNDTLEDASECVPGKEATCEDEQVCITCGKVIQNALGHDWDTDYECQTDNPCRRCGKAAADHDWTDSETCKICHYQMSDYPVTMNFYYCQKTPDLTSYSYTDVDGFPIAEEVWKIKDYQWDVEANNMIVEMNNVIGDVYIGYRLWEDDEYNYYKIEYTKLNEDTYSLDTYAITEALNEYGAVSDWRIMIKVANAETKRYENGAIPLWIMSYDEYSGMFASIFDHY